jgi:hypothetical protein
LRRVERAEPLQRVVSREALPNQREHVGVWIGAEGLQRGCSCDGGLAGICRDLLQQPTCRWQSVAGDIQGRGVALKSCRRLAIPGNNLLRGP